MIAILILTALAAFAVLVAVAVVVMGYGGQLARFEADHPPLDLPTDRPVSSRDVARIRLPLTMWGGYHVRAVDELLGRMAAGIDERDARIAQLEARLGERGTSVPGPRVWYPRPSPGATEEETGGERGADPDNEEAETAVPATSARGEHGGSAEER